MRDVEILSLTKLIIMNTPRVSEPIWIISFDHSIKGTHKEQAFFHIPFPHIIQFSGDKHAAINFLEKMNDSFKKMTELFLEEAEKEEINKPQADEIREKFKSLDSWIQWLKDFEQENQNPEDKKIE
jgi:hypothetical protein